MNSSTEHFTFLINQITFVSVSMILALQTMSANIKYVNIFGVMIQVYCLVHKYRLDHTYPFIGAQIN